MHEPGDSKRIVNDVRRWTALIEICAKHISTRELTSVRLDMREDIEKIEMEWMSYYSQLIEERDGVCLSDLMLVTLCHLWFCNKPPTDAQTVEARKAIANGDLVGNLRIVLCQHVHPKPEHVSVETLRVWVTVAVVLCGHTYEQLCSSEKSSDQLLASLSSLKLVPKNESDAKAAQIAKEKGDTTNVGWLWSAKDNLLFKTLLPLANRVLHKHATDVYILRRYEQLEITERPYTETMANNFRNWLTDRCRYQCADEFSLRYHSMVYEAWLPLHSRQQRDRCKMTQFDQAMALQVMEEEIGVDTAISLTEIVNTDIKDVVKDPTHRMYDYLVLSMFNYVMLHTCMIKFFDEYYLPNWQQGRQLLKLKENNDGWTQLRTERRPFIFQISHKWYVQHQRVMYPCVDATDAILCWLSVIRKTYKDKLEYGVTISHFVSVFMGAPELD